MIFCAFAQSDIMPYGIVIFLPLAKVILYSPPKLAKRISLGVSRISLRSNRTRRQANTTSRTNFHKNNAFGFPKTYIFIQVQFNLSPKVRFRLSFSLFFSHTFYGLFSLLFSGFTQPTNTLLLATLFELISLCFQQLFVSNTFLFPATQSSYKPLYFNGFELSFHYSFFCFYRHLGAGNSFYRGFKIELLTFPVP